MENKLLNLLISLDICTDDSIYQFYPKVRDRDDISVMRCKKSGVIFLSCCDHAGISHYENIREYKDWTPFDQDQVKADDLRRAEEIRNLIRKRKWLDVGCGKGGLLKILSQEPEDSCAVEPQKNLRTRLKEEGFRVYPAIDEVPDENFDFITLFHVFEHMADPVGALKSLHRKLSPAGKIIIEVPHANDFLISTFNLKSFKDFTFFSEHLILHTKKSLHAFLSCAGYSNIRITGCQRYPFSNHLYWILKNGPGGHRKWPFLQNNLLNTAYASFLRTLSKTDTLIATAHK
ncbi:MAG: class I SAM-dependent methyltransferase [Candidatus Omnitrophota bacterium]